jgi:diguanylate cyclase (GGDEF)-like protein
MQQDPDMARVPVIVVTGSIEAGAVRALDAGAHDFLPKPFEPEELLARVRAALRVKQAHDELTRQARVDVLTGLPNRRALDEALAHAIGHCWRRGEDLSLVLMDVVDFKGVNDVHGHTVGDEVLRAIGHALEATRRSGDVVGRWGGDEYLAILPGASADEARAAVTRLRHAVTASVRVPGRTIDLRAGLSTCAPSSTVRGDHLVRAAAAQLHEAHAAS